MFDKFSLNICKIFKGAEKEMLELKHPYVGSEHLLLALLKSNKDVIEISNKYNLTYQKFKTELINIVGSANNKSTFILYTPLLKRIINIAMEDALKDGVELSSKYLFRAIFDEGEGIAIRILLSMGINIDKLYNDIKVNKKTKINNNLEVLNIGKNMSDEVNINDVVVGRDKEIEIIIETLIRRNKNNPLLIGDAGVGKTAIVEELARRIKKKEVPEKLLDSRIISLELGSLVAGTKYRGEFEEKLTKIIKELENNSDIIVFIDEIHSIVNAGGAEGAINASDILKPYLARGKIKVIGATTTEEYNKYILKDKALSRRFEVVKVIEPDIDETINILSKIKRSYEKHYDLKITAQNIKEIVNLSNKYIVDRKNPDKAIDILDSVCAMVSVKKTFSKESVKIKKDLVKLENKKESLVKSNDFLEATKIQEKIIELKEKLNKLPLEEKVINKEDILSLISKKCNIPLLENQEKIIRKLEGDLKEKIFGQSKAINKIINSIKNNWLMNKPTCLLLTGNTGVGKTETVKVMAKSMNMNLIRLDMSEYNLDIASSKLIGASAGYIGYDDGAILNKIKMYPYSIILVDELEKASLAVQNLFLQIMDEGFITNSQGEKLDFKNSIIVMTSNIEGNKKIGFLETSLDYTEYLSREFLARFDEIISYDNISRKVVEEYLNSKGIKDFSIIDSIDYKKYGLREVKRAIKNYKNLINN